LIGKRLTVQIRDQSLLLRFGAGLWRSIDGSPPTIAAVKRWRTITGPAAG
jgi:hypothetical protein